MPEPMRTAPSFASHASGPVPRLAEKPRRMYSSSVSLGYDDSTLIGSLRKRVIASFARIPADWDTNVFITTWNYIRFGHLHTLRSMQPLLYPIASQEERSELYRSYGIRSTGTLNLLTWRRSALVACFVIALGASTLLAAVARTSSDDLYVMEQTSYLPTNGTALRDCQYEAQQPIYVAYKSPGGNTSFYTYAQPDRRECTMPFVEYQSKIVQIALARTALPAKQIDVILDVILAAFAWIALVPTLMALSRWHRYGLSLRLVSAAWLLTFVTPFLVSIIPVRMFVDWDAMDAIFADYAAEFRTHFGTATYEQTLLDLCGFVSGYAGDDPAAIVDNVCNVVDRLPTSVDGSAFATINANLAAAKVACEQARQLIGAGTDQMYLAQAKGICASVTPFLDGSEGGAGSAELMLVVSKLIEQMRGYVELTIGLAHALMSFQIMVPAAISLAPGLIRGAMRAKTLVPQSSIPGMFILMLPWLYCPLVWCMYNIIFQLLGNLIMLMGLLLLAYGPMTYFVLGLHFNVTKPMTDHKMRQVLTWMNYYIIMYTSVAYSCIVYFIFFTDARELIENALKEFKNPQLALAILFSILSKYLYTTLMGVDFMVHEIAEQRRWETYLSTGVMPFADVRKLHMSDEARDGVKRLMYERTARLDELARIVNDKTAS
uniref:Uncharacterized protein n=1 Tax=Diacronema lutheri TaxID=2081491 RepID=A0A7R9UPC8_DIALT